MADHELLFPTVADATTPDPKAVRLLGRGEPTHAFERVQGLVAIDLAKDVLQRATTKLLIQMALRPRHP